MSMFRTTELTLGILPPLFQGLYLLQQTTSLCEEASHLEVAGLQKVELALSRSNVEGLYGLLQDVSSHTSFTSCPAPHQETLMGCHCCHSWAPPRVWKCWHRAPSICGWGGVQAQEAPSLAIPQALEVNIPANMTPLHPNVGATRGFISIELRSAVKDHPISHVAIYIHVHQAHLSVKLACPPCPQTFLNLDALRWHKKQVHTSGWPTFISIFVIISTIVLVNHYIRKVTSIQIFIVKSC